MLINADIQAYFGNLSSGAIPVGAPAGGTAPLPYPRPGAILYSLLGPYRHPDAQTPETVPRPRGGELQGGDPPRRALRRPQARPTGRLYASRDGPDPLPGQDRHCRDGPDRQDPHLRHTGLGTPGGRLALYSSDIPLRERCRREILPLVQRANAWKLTLAYPTCSQTAPSNSWTCGLRRPAPYARAARPSP